MAEQTRDIEDLYTVVKGDNGDIEQYASYDEATHNHDAAKVWAVVEGDDDEEGDTVFGVLPGWHLVNVLYYLATEEPYNEAHEGYEFTY